MPLPPLPKLFHSAGLGEVGRRVYDWASAAQNLLQVLRSTVPGIREDVDEVTADLEAVDVRLVVVEAEVDANLGPAAETEVGTYGLVPRYRQRFSGASLSLGSNTLIASGVSGIVRAGGWIEDDAANKHGFPIAELQTANFRASLHVSTAGALILTTGSAVDTNPYDVWVEYTKT